MTIYNSLISQIYIFGKFSRHTKTITATRSLGITGLKPATGLLSRTVGNGLGQSPH